MKATIYFMSYIYFWLLSSSSKDLYVFKSDRLMLKNKLCFIANTAKVLKILRSKTFGATIKFFMVVIITHSTELILG